MKPNKGQGAPAPIQEHLLNVEEVAAMLGQASKTLRNRLGRGTLGIPAIRLGRSVRFHPRDVSALIERCRETA